MQIFGYTIDYIPSFGWALIWLFVILLLAIFVVKQKSNFALVFGRLYESMMDFFADILEEDAEHRMTSYITNMFFIILLYNLLGLIFDFIGPIFGYDASTGEFALSKIIGFGTANLEFNIAMAMVGVVISLIIQFRSMSSSDALGKHISDASWNTPFLKTFNFIYEYIPFWWKWILTIEKWNMSAVLYYPLRVVIKVFDVIISLFVGFLDIIGVAAKIISLSFRLFGNMMSWSMLFAMLVIGLSSATKWRFGVEFPLVGHLILVIQWLLVALIQAFVFSLLIAIFIKVAKGEDEN